MTEDIPDDLGFQKFLASEKVSSVHDSETGETNPLTYDDLEEQNWVLTCIIHMLLLERGTSKVCLPTDIEDGLEQSGINYMVYVDDNENTWLEMVEDDDNPYIQSEEGDKAL